MPNKHLAGGIILVVVFLLACVTICFSFWNYPARPASYASGIPPVRPGNPSSVKWISSSQPDSSFSQTQVPGSDRARALLNGMSLEEKIGQVFLARCPVNDANAWISAYHPGGYILFANNLASQSPASLTYTISGYQKASGVPMFIAVDEEGGSIVRLSKFPAFRDRPFPSPQDILNDGGLDAVYENARDMAAMLLSHGINLNLAPVCDVSTNPQDYIYSRTAGLDAQGTAQYVRAAVGGMQDAGISCVLKHFPGYGNNADTHTGIAVDNRPFSQFEASDFSPVSSRDGSWGAQHFSQPHYCKLH